MKRLTKWIYHKDGSKEADFNVEFTTQKESYLELIQKVLNKLAEYEDAEEDAEENGTLIRLPFKVGDTAYVIREYFYPSYKERVREIQISSIEFSSNDIFIHDYDGCEYFIEEVFFTREEAEAKIKENEK